MFPAQVVAIVSAIVGGAPFARSLTPLPTNRASVSFPQLDPEDPEWVAELGEIPLLTPDTSEYEVAVSKLAGSILISVESIEDTDFPVTQQTEQILRDTFSAQAGPRLHRRRRAAPDPDRHPGRGPPRSPGRLATTP